MSCNRRHWVWNRYNNATVVPHSVRYFVLPFAVKYRIENAGENKSPYSIPYIHIQELLVQCVSKKHPRHF